MLCLTSTSIVVMLLQTCRYLVQCKLVACLANYSYS